MAKNDSTEAAEDTEAEASGGGLKKIMILAAVVVVSVGGSVAGTVFYLQAGSAAEQEPAAEVAAVEPSDAKALYHNMRPPFVVNFMTGDKARLLQTEITIMSRDPAVMDAVVSHGPLLRNKLINLISDQDFLEMQTVEGKRALSEQARQLIDETIDAEAGVRGVERVLFTNFVMQ